MKKYLIAIAIAFSALFGLSVQASPLASASAVLKSEVTTADAVQKVQHWRWGSGGWHGGGGHWRWGSGGWRRPGWGAWGGGWGRPGWGAWGGGCRLRCNPWRCWRVCW